VFYLIDTREKCVNLGEIGSRLPIPPHQMRRCRLKIVHQSACYHIVCHITQGQLWLADSEKLAFAILLQRLAPYCGIEVLTYCVMSDHFHLLVRIPPKAVADAALDGVELSRRVGMLYGADEAERVRVLWEERALPGGKHHWEDELEMHLGRMHDLSVFMQLLKQRFTMGRNRSRGTKGTIWTERFKSVLVEDRSGERNPVQIVGAYIDLNPVRAGVVGDAKDYPHSGFGSACMGNTSAQQGLSDLSETNVWAKARAWFEQFVAGNFCPSTTDSSAMADTPDSGNCLRRSLRTKQASLVKGFVLGSAKFVMEILVGLAEIRASARPQAYACGGFGADLWVGGRHRKS
jgi:REP element-mobilizing transposase RayT